MGKKKNSRKRRRDQEARSPEAANTNSHEMKKLPEKKSLLEGESATSTELAPFGTRKRSLPKVDYVFPNKNGLSRPYTFTKRMNGESQHDDGEQKDQKESLDEPRPAKNESLQDILYGGKKKPLVEEQQQQKKPKLEVAKEGQKEKSVAHKAGPASPKNGFSVRVEEAVLDKLGCRPRSNSTDDELNLPQRGLCDEQKVLATYRWNQEGTGSPKGFGNLGNSCYLNSTLQCLAHLPPFCQTLQSLPCPNSENGVKRKTSQSKKFTMMLRSLFHQVHSFERTKTIDPRAIVQAVPTLGSCGSRNGYKFRHGRQEDAHEFLVHLLDAMNDGELKEAGVNQHVSGWRDRLPIPRLDETTFIHRIFGGYFRSQVQCTSCSHR
jgi:hypothetical protein